MDILAEITNHKYKEVTRDKELFPVSTLEKSIFFERKCISLKAALLDPSKDGIIAEFKRKSPSKGIFSEGVRVEEVTTGYIKAGASALSVLTDENYFGGSLRDLATARTFNNVPVLRKDFMVDEYQILAAKAAGADVILLIAASTETGLLNRLAKFAKSLGLETLLEIKEKEELDGNLSEYIDVVGINNRNLTNFTVDINTSKELVQYIPDNFVKISESGIGKPEVIKDLRTYGFKGFLMGEAFMQTADPIGACDQFIKSLH